MVVVPLPCARVEKGQALQLFQCVGSSNSSGAVDSTMLVSGLPREWLEPRAYSFDLCQSREIHHSPEHVTFCGIIPKL